MLKWTSTGLACAAVFAASPGLAENYLQGDWFREDNFAPPHRDCDLYQGDLEAEINLGCANENITLGGPNGVAVRVTAPLATPFTILSHRYHIGTEVSPTITALTFSVWKGGSTLGEVIGQQSGLDWAPGNHSFTLQPPISVDSAQFFFGQVQPQASAGLRWGLDTSSGGGTTSYLRAPGCEVPNWATLTSIGFAGNWVMTVCVEGVATPIELSTWGSIKNTDWN